MQLGYLRFAKADGNHKHPKMMAWLANSRWISGPFVWTADPEVIVEKVQRGYHALASVRRQVS